MIATITLNPSLDQRIAVERFSTGETLRALAVARHPGGKGVNVSRVVNQLGGETLAFGLVGGLSGRMLLVGLDELGMPHRFVEIQNETRINTTLRDISRGSETHIRVEGPQVTEEELARFTAEALSLRPAPRYWVLGGSLPPGVPSHYYRDLIRNLGKTGASCVLDADDEALLLGIEAAPYIIKPNEREFERLTGVAADREEKIVRESRRLLERGVGIVMTTLAERGMVVVSRTAALRVTASAVDAKKKVGAGDATLAGFLVALERGAVLAEAARFGAATAAAFVMGDDLDSLESSAVERLLREVSVSTLG